MHPTASEWNVQSSFQCWVLPRTTERVSFTSRENPKARSCRFSDPVVRHFFLPLPPASMKSAQVCGSPIPLSRVAPRSCTAWLQRAAAPDGSRPASTSSNGHASPTARPSSRAAAASSSATSCRSSSAAPAAARGFPSCRRSGSGIGAPRSNGTDDSSAASSSPPTCLP